ncbi:toll/interleukin-1 receptor domain-containing protein [Lysinibacillus sp. NPDC056959]|uniref:toll/interleukin-1 receptor domain-containing protein n=1 Tax=Lysinibacillus sp. NPDC056959 TaxID=3345981 RepID=UPI00362E6B9F
MAFLLEEAGYKTFYQPWDFKAGNNFVLEMQKGAKFAIHTLALIFENYLASLYTQPEWAAAFGADPTGTQRKLIPVRIQDIY